MTTTMILKEIHALPAREKNKLLKRLGGEREAVAETPGRVSEKQLFHLIENIGRKQRTALTAKEMNAARLEGRK